MFGGQKPHGVSSSRSGCEASVARIMEEGRFRIISQPERWAALMGLMPFLREACQRSIEAAEERFGLELPKYW